LMYFFCHFFGLCGLTSIVPLYQHSGSWFCIGSDLVYWGISQADEQHVLLTVMASPFGFLLRSKLGFKTLGNSITQVPGEEEKVDSDAFVYEYSKL